VAARWSVGAGKKQIFLFGGGGLSLVVWQGGGRGAGWGWGRSCCVGGVFGLGWPGPLLFLEESDGSLPKARSNQGCQVRLSRDARERPPPPKTEFFSWQMEANLFEADRTSSPPERHSFFVWPNRCLTPLRHHSQRAPHLLGFSFPAATLGLAPPLSPTVRELGVQNFLGTCVVCPGSPDLIP